MQFLYSREVRRGIAGLAAITCVLSVSAAHAQAQATMQGNQLAYDAAVKCFVANGIASGERGDAGDTEKAAAYEASARRSFDTATALGHALGFTNGRINQDFGLAQAKELPKLVKDQGYYRSTAATCMALGLM